MTTRRRWALVALLLAVVVGVPTALRAVPPADSDVAAADLLALVRGAEGRAWSGYVETRGTLQLPTAGGADDFDGVAALFGERTRLRAWWRGDDDWRVDRLLATGESDLRHDDGLTVAWSYERSEAELSRDPAVRLPRTADLVPPVLGARVLRGVDAGDVERVPSRRVAGIAAPGLRVRPAAPQASIDHVDLWADPVTGVPLRVEVHAAPADLPADLPADRPAGRPSDPPDFTSAFGDFSRTVPPASITDFAPTATTDVEVEQVLDIADAANQYAPLRPPGVVGGLPRTSASAGAVGVYGTGLTQLVAIPLRPQEAEPLRAQLRTAIGAVEVPGLPAVRLSVGPLGVLVTGQDDEGAWLVAGTVDAPTLERAGLDLLTGTRVVQGR